jgi:hypothetical protein
MTWDTSEKNSNDLPGQYQANLKFEKRTNLPKFYFNFISGVRG